MGCPIRILKDHRSHAAPPERFAGLRVLHRPSVPRHPPRTLVACSRMCSFFPPVRGSAGKVPLLLLLLYGKIEVRKDSVVESAGCQSPGNWRVENSLRCFFLSRPCFDLGVAWPGGQARLPRKEVIQPHLPVRLPCYDFTPITDPTLDACLPQGVSPAASGVADFRGVTGGVY